MDKYTWIIFAEHRTDRKKNKYVVVRVDEEISKAELQRSLDNKYPEFIHQNGRSISGHMPVERVDL